jgi:hypothetical protein
MNYLLNRNDTTTPHITIRAKGNVRGKGEAMEVTIIELTVVLLVTLGILAWESRQLNPRR